MKSKRKYFSAGIDTVASAISRWRASKGFRTDWFNVPEQLMLVVTELSEAMEAYRHLEQDTLHYLRIVATGPTSDDTPSEGQMEFVDNFVEELADAVIRLLDLAASLGIGLSLAVDEKMQKNEGRPHKHGKQC